MTPCRALAPAHRAARSAPSIGAEQRAFTAPARAFHRPSPTLASSRHPACRVSFVDHAPSLTLARARRCEPSEPRGHWPAQATRLADRVSARPSTPPGCGALRASASLSRVRPVRPASALANIHAARRSARQRDHNDDLASARSCVVIGLIGARVTAAASNPVRAVTASRAGLRPAARAILLASSTVGKRLRLTQPCRRLAAFQRGATRRAHKRRHTAVIRISARRRFARTP